MKRLYGIAMVFILMACRQEIFDFELAHLEELCGGKDKVNAVWIDGNIPQARCHSGERVSVRPK